MSVHLVPDVEVARAARAAGFPASEIPNAVAVALAESGVRQNFLKRQVLVNTLAVGVNAGGTHPGSKDLGAWQINDYWQADLLKRHDWRNLNQNAQMAFYIWNGRRRNEKFGNDGWTAWNAYKSGRHVQYLARGRAAAAALGGTPVRPIFSRLLYLERPFMTGEDVRALQRLVRATPDGDFGPRTEAALRVAQKLHGVHVDGVLGPITAKALGGRWVGK